MNSEQIRAQRSFNLSRRHFLRGLGAAVALPAFTSMPTRLFASEPGAVPLATTASGAPLRTAFVYFPNGAIPSAWWPKTEDEKNFDLQGTLSPLEPARQHIQVLGGLNHENANPGPDGAGDHARANGTFLTGVRMKKSAVDVRAGISIDQAIAQRIGHLTRFPSLELTCENSRRSGACDSGYACAYQFNLSWSSETTPMAAEANPRMVFERLFGAGSHGERNESLVRRQREQRSILDFVMEDARAMQRRLDTSDKSKLDQYLTGIREIETRIEKAERFGNVPDPNVDTPSGVPTSYEQYGNLMFDMLALAFQTDSTRVATFLLAHDGSNRPFGDIGIFEGHHDLSHHQNREEWVTKVAQIDQWYARQFAKFLKKLEETKDTDGNSLLHNCQIVYGSGNADGNRHTHTNLPLILAGAGGGTLTPGRYVKHNSKPTSNLFLTMSDRLGIQGLERFGDSTGRLTNV
jgi:hypothetical protein